MIGIVTGGDVVEQLRHRSNRHFLLRRSGQVFVDQRSHKESSEAGVRNELDGIRRAVVERSEMATVQQSSLNPVLEATTTALLRHNVLLRGHAQRVNGAPTEMASNCLGFFVAEPLDERLSIETRVQFQRNQNAQRQKVGYFVKNFQR